MHFKEQKLVGKMSVLKFYTHLSDRLDGATEFTMRVQVTGIDELLVEMTWRDRPKQKGAKFKEHAHLPPPYQSDESKN